MERLTKHVGNEIYVECGDKIDITEKGIIDLLKNKLVAYEDAEEQGRLVVLPEKTLDFDFMRAFELILADFEGRAVVFPCKVGDTVYYIDGGKSYKAKASTFRFNESGVRVYCERNFMGYIGFEGIYGKTVFLTREEAEKALEGMNNG